MGNTGLMNRASLHGPTNTPECARYGAWITPQGVYHHVDEFGHIDYAIDEWGAGGSTEDIVEDMVIKRGFVRVVRGEGYLAVTVGRSLTDEQVSALSRYGRVCATSEVSLEVWQRNVRPRDWFTKDYPIGTNWARIRADIDAVLGVK